MSAYWAQYSHSELMSMQGVEVDELELDEDVDTDLYQDKDDTDSYQDRDYCCSGCMSCLGVSW